MNQYNLEGITFPSEKDNWKKTERDNTKIALNVLYPKNIFCLCFKTDVSKQLKLWKTSYCFNDFKWKGTRLSCINLLQ